MNLGSKVKPKRNELSRPMRRCEACGNWTDPDDPTTTRYLDGVVTCWRHGVYLGRRARKTDGQSS